MVRAAMVDSLPAGSGRLLLVNAVSDGGPEERVTTIWHMKFRAEVENGFTVSIEIRNAGVHSLDIESIVSVALVVDARSFGADSAYKFWSFQGGTYPERPDWAFPLTRTFSRANFQGMNAPDYGGGMPFVDLWTRRGGIALASLAPRPEPLALPVRVLKDGRVEVKIVDQLPVLLPPGAKVAEQPFMAIFHSGDFFNPLRTYYAQLMQQGPSRPSVPASAYGAEWCAWGYERAFVPGQILQTLPLVRRLGFEWVTIDDGYQNADGDWMVDREKFPEGSKDMRALVDSIHVKGMKARLWWVPLEAHDSSYSAAHFPGRMKEFGMSLQSELAKNHPDWFQMNADGSRTQVSWWNSYTLCPALPEVRRYYCHLVTRFLQEWGFDGFKIDGQNMNAVPPCYNSAHHHTSPLDAPRSVPEFFRDVYATATSVRLDAVLYVCACGTNFSVYNLPFVTIPVAADPVSSWQVRHRAKAYKALLGGRVPYSGDHVELTNRVWDEVQQRSIMRGEEDFASTVGVGGVIATKFTSPRIAQADSSMMLGAEKEAVWKKWLDIYRREKVSEGEYMNLYDIAYDKPETHVVARGDTLFYAMYSEGTFSGSIGFRGLTAGKYALVDYVHGITLGNVSRTHPKLRVTFDRSLLVKAIPK